MYAHLSSSSRRYRSRMPSCIQLHIVHLGRTLQICMNLSRPVPRWSLRKAAARDAASLHIRLKCACFGNRLFEGFTFHYFTDDRTIPSIANASIDRISISTIWLLGFRKLFSSVFYILFSLEFILSRMVPLEHRLLIYWILLLHSPRYRYIQWNFTKTKCFRNQAIRL